MTGALPSGAAHLFESKSYRVTRADSKRSAFDDSDEHGCQHHSASRIKAREPPQASNPCRECCAVGIRHITCCVVNLLCAPALHAGP